MLVGAMALTLLAVGGVAAVSAADPSTSPAPNATSEPADPGSSAQPDGTDSVKGACPERDGTDNGSGGDGGSESSPDATPNASDSDV
jgi:hypothetical protein